MDKPRSRAAFTFAVMRKGSDSSKQGYQPLSPRYTLTGYDQRWRGRLMQMLVDWLHRCGD